MSLEAVTAAQARHPAADLRSPSTGARRLAVVVPCFNEVQSLPRLCAELTRLEAALAQRYDTQLVLVDDGSQDETYAELLREYGERTDATVVRHPTNRGIAAAIATGIQHAEAELVASLDADCTYEPVETVLSLLEHLTDEAAMVVASPYHPAGAVVGVPAWRLAISKMASRCYRLVMRNKLHTYTSCVRVYRKSAVASLPPTQGGFVGIVELLWQLDRRGARIAEAPAVLRVRTTGQSKMRLMRTTLAHGRLLVRAALARPFRQAAGQISQPTSVHSF